MSVQVQSNEFFVFTAPGNNELAVLERALAVEGLEATRLDLDRLFGFPEEFNQLASASVVIILIEDIEVLNKLAAAGELLFRYRILLIVPDQSHETITAAHLIRPRLVINAGGDYMDIAAIVKKMLGENMIQPDE